MAVCVAIKEDDRSLKYLRCQNRQMQQQFDRNAHPALDMVEMKLLFSGKSSGDLCDIYLGLLYSTEEHKFFGYVTNTKIRYIIAVESSDTHLGDTEIRKMFRKLHAAYTHTSSVVCKPFYMPGASISPYFAGTVDNIMKKQSKASQVISKNCDKQ